MNIRAVQALRTIGQGILELAEALAAANEVGISPPAKQKPQQATEEPDEPFPTDKTESPGADESVTKGTKKTTQDADPPTLKDLQKAAKKLIDQGKREKLQKVLSDAGASSLSGIEESDYSKTLAALQK